MPKGTIHVDVSKCAGCQRCVVACAMSHAGTDDYVAAMRLDPPPRSRIVLQVIGNDAVPASCRHCEDAPCMEACNREALVRSAPGEPVLQVLEKCNGCGQCSIACPYGVIRIHPHPEEKRGKAHKCDLCVDRTAKGLIPACAEACTTGALYYLAPDQAEDLVPAKGAGRFEHKDMLFSESPVVTHLAPAAGAEAGTKKEVVRCQTCNAPIAMRGEIDLTKKRVPGMDTVTETTCPECKRRAYARIIVQEGRM